MALDPTTPRSRRALLTAAVAATAVTVVEAVVRPLRSGIGVAAVRPNYPSAGKIRIYLTRTVSSATSVAWMVMD